MGARKILERALNNPRGLRFAEFQKLAGAFGFELARVNGSHHVYRHPDVRELLNMQDVRGEAKAYQVRQLLSLVEEYNLRLED